MRRLLTLATAAVLGAAAAGVARAAPLKWEGTLKIELGEMPPVNQTGTAVSTVNGSGGVGHLSTISLTGGFTGVGTVPVTDPDITTADGITQIVVTLSGVGPGALARTSSGGPLATTANQLGVKGLVRLCLMDPSCESSFLSTPLTVHTAGSGISGVGVGGVLTISDTAASIRVTISGAPWTLGQVSAVSETDSGTVTRFSTGFAHGPGSNTSSTASTSGVVKFVSPLQITTKLPSNSGNAKKMSGFASMTLRFVPEPGMLLLLGSGAVGLVLLGRHRMQK